MERQKRHKGWIHAEEPREISRPLSFYQDFRHTPARCPMQTYAFLILGIISTGLTPGWKHMASGWPRKKKWKEGGNARNPLKPTGISVTIQKQAPSFPRSHCHGWIREVQAQFKEKCIYCCSAVSTGMHLNGFAMSKMRSESQHRQTQTSHRVWLSQFHMETWKSRPCCQYKTLQGTSGNGSVGAKWGRKLFLFSCLKT